MSLKLMYITNRPEVARVAEKAGVDRIFVDMEYIGKDERQGGLDTVKNHHTVENVRSIRQAINSAELLVRINPIHDETEEYWDTKTEIEAVVDAGADIIMLPYFKTVDEAKEFISLVNGRAKTMLLMETPECIEAIDDIMKIDGVDEVFIGINDLSLGYGKKFMFELLADGTVEKICKVFKANNKVYGFGGIASLGKGMLPSDYVIREHYKLGSTCAILSRSFCNVNMIDDIDVIDGIFTEGLRDIRAFEKECEKLDFSFEDNIREIRERVGAIVAEIKR